MKLIKELAFCTAILGTVALLYWCHGIYVQLVGDDPYDKTSY